MQGEGAAEKIASAIKDVNRRNNKLKLDVLIVGRGGGSLEDLWAFNEEVLARAIYDSRIPVISAVGHEVDTTIADLVADARASTPTKAGVVAVPDMRQVLEDLENKEAYLNRNIMLCVQYGGQQLDEGFAELVKAIKELLAENKDKLHHFYEEVIKIEPHRLLGRKTVEVNDFRSRANAVIAALIGRVKIQLAEQDNRLAGLNPKAVLKRGYSITTLKKTGAMIKNAADVQIGDEITLSLIHI